MKYIKIFTLISILIFIACAKDVVDTTGTIEGIVKDNTTSTPLQGCAVTLSPTGKSVTTGQDGHYAFEALDANNYSIEYSKVGYEANKKEVTVVAGRTMQVDVMLKKISNALTVNPDVLNFGDLETSKSLFVSAIEQLVSIRYTIKADADWISFNATEGNATSVGNKITVVIDRSNLSTGNYEKNITISSTYGDVIIPVIVNQVERNVATLTTGLPENITETSLTIKGTIIKTGGSKIISYGHCWAENENPTIDNNKTNLGDTEAVGDFTSTLTQLVPGKTYYIRAYAINSTGAAYSEQATVKIPFIEKPTVATLAISGLCKDSVVLNGEITNDGDGNIKEHGFYWGYTENTEYKQSIKLPSDSKETKFAYTKKNLLSDTTYYYKAYAVNEKGESCGEVKKFKSLDKNLIEGVPVVETNEATNITTSSATLNGIIVNSGDTKVIQRGFYFGTSENSMTKKIIESTDSIMVLNLTGLKDATKYYFKAFAVNQKGESCGGVNFFTTVESKLPTVVTSEVSNVTFNSATLNGIIANSGDTKVIQRGFYYGTSENSMTKKIIESADSIMVLNLTGLKDATKYYFKAFAVNQKGESCGTVNSFTTTESKLPTVVTSEVSNITFSSATLNGIITDCGDTKVIQRGFYFGTSENSMTKKIIESTDSIMVLNLTGLSDSTKYYFKAFAVNQKGENCGTVNSFTTDEGKLPTVVTANATDISYEKATLKGAVVDAGDFEIIEYGFYYGTSENSMVKIKYDGFYDDMNITVGNLANKTLYYYKAYATTKKGETCGEINTFTTTEGKQPTVVTANATDISYENATLKGAVVDAGDFEIIEYGFYCGTSENSMVKFVGDGSYDNMSVTVGDLTTNTLYYYKAYAATKKGEAYGNVQMFTTLDESIVLPWDGTVATSYGGGSGTYIDPYLIKTPSQLAYMASEGGKSGCYYKLMYDIDLNNKPWKPIPSRGHISMAMEKPYPICT